MPLVSFPNLEFASWQTWVIPVAGLGAAAVAVLVGRLAQSRWGHVAPPPQEADAPVHDPFDHGSMTEQRMGVRRKGNPIEVLISDAEATQEPMRGWVINRSTNGLCLLLDEEIAVGTVLSVKPRQAPPGMPWVRAEVRSCTRDQSGYQAGCKFLATPPWGILLLFG